MTRRLDRVPDGVAGDALRREVIRFALLLDRLDGMAPGPDRDAVAEEVTAVARGIEAIAVEHGMVPPRDERRRWWRR